MIEPKKKDLPVKPNLEDLLKLGKDMFEEGPGKKKTKKKDKKRRKKSTESKKVRSQKLKSNRIKSSSESVASIYKRKKPKFISK